MLRSLFGKPDPRAVTRKAWGKLDGKAFALQRQGKLAEAEHLYQDALKLAEATPDDKELLAMAVNNLAVCTRTNSGMTRLYRCSSTRGG